MLLDVKAGFKMAATLMLMWAWKSSGSITFVKNWFVCMQSVCMHESQGEITMTANLGLLSIEITKSIGYGVSCVLVFMGNCYMLLQLCYIIRFNYMFFFLVLFVYFFKCSNTFQFLEEFSNLYLM